MTIGLDASKAVKQFKTGTETYSIEIIRALAAIDKKNRYLLYSPTPVKNKISEIKNWQNFENVVIPFPKLWTQFRLSWEMIKHKPDVLFIPAHTLPLVFPQKTVVTLHDLGFKHYPGLYSRKELFYHNWAMNHAVKNASHIITDCQFTKNDLLLHYPLDPAKISVVWLGYDEKLFRPQEKRITQKPYLFYVGRLEEKKNIRGMIAAYGILRREGKIRHQFILAGRPGFGYDKIQAEIRKLPENIQKDVIELGYIDQATYIEYLKNADILFFASFFEGFGLPLVEAMASGVPIVASNRTSIPEICSKAAILVNPKNHLEMAAALNRLINNPNLRKTLISKELARAALFSWKKTAQKTLQIIEEIHYNKL